MRITIGLDHRLLGQARRHALETGRTLDELIRDALAVALAQERSKAFSRRVELKTFKGRGVFEGVNIDNTASLLDRMDQGHK